MVSGNKDYQHAKMWYEKAAAQNDRRAQVNLAVLYKRVMVLNRIIDRPKAGMKKAAAQIVLMRSSLLEFCMHQKC